MIFGYTMTGIKFVEEKFDVINNFYITKHHDLILGFYKLKYLYLCKGSNLSILKKKPLYFYGREVNGIFWFEKTLNKKFKILYGFEKKTNFIFEIEGEEEWTNKDYNI